MVVALATRPGHVFASFGLHASLGVCAIYPNDVTRLTNEMYWWAERGRDGGGLNVVREAFFFMFVTKARGNV